MPGPTGRNRHAQAGTRTCAHCREEFRKYSGRLRLDALSGKTRLVSTVGVRRRVQALARLGWTQREICARVGIHPSKMNKIMRLNDKVNREVAEKIIAVYRELVASGELGKDQRVQRYALRQGWAGPLDWDDIDNPDEVPLCEITRAHVEALAEEKLRQRREQRAQRDEEQRARHRREQQAYRERRRQREQQEQQEQRELAGAAA